MISPGRHPSTGCVYISLVTLIGPNPYSFVHSSDILEVSRSFVVSQDLRERSHTRHKGWVDQVIAAKHNPCSADLLYHVIGF